MQTTTYQTKEDIIKQIQLAYQEVTSFVINLDQKSFKYNPGEKWSVSDQLEHLILSSKGVPSALNMSKLKLMIFGKSKTGSRSYDELFGSYKDVLNTGTKAPPKYSPDQEKTWTREELLANWKMIEDKFSDRIANWSEKDLDSYCLPHPALGKVTMRETLLFTIFHTNHHLKSMKALFN
ncbi:MAG: hypothetical protein ACI8P3_001554 [Saprospiraceae bacterium]|jgi:hypothetical protein